MNRIDRLNAISTHLQSKKRVTAQEIADRFGISLRSVYRDIKALEESGVPVIGEAGMGYTIMEGYRLPAVMFTQEEASALLLGAKFAAQLTDAPIKKHFDNALFKVKSVIRATDKDHLEQLEDNVIIHAFRAPSDDSFNEHLSTIQKAIIARLVVDMEYYSPYSDQETKRSIEPIGLAFYGGAWHCIAWCRIRNDYRDFRLNRIRKLCLTPISFQGANHPSIKDYIGEITHQMEVEEVVLNVHQSAARLIHEQKYFYGFVSEEKIGDRVRMTLLGNSSTYYAKWVLTLLDQVEIEAPATLREKGRELCGRLQEHYNK